MAQSSLSPGAIVEGYRITASLSSTAYGAVYRAVDTEGSEVILKEIVSAGSPEEVEERGNLLLDALEFLAEVEHPGVVRILDFFSARQRVYVVMEQVQGRTLEDALADGSFTTGQALSILIGVCDALERLHEGEWKYRFADFSPSHVMLDEKGEPRLVGFGLTRFFCAPAPKSAFTDDDEAVRFHLLSLGRLLVFMATGREGEPETAAGMLREELTPALALFFSGGRSFESAAELRARLVEMLMHHEAAPVFVPLIRPIERNLSEVQRRIRLRRVFLALAAVALVCVLFFRGIGALMMAGDAVYVLCADGRVFLHAPRNGAVKGSFTVPGSPSDFAWKEDDKALVFAVPGGKKLLFVDPRTRRVTRELSLRIRPERLLVDPVGRLLIAISRSENVVAVLSGKGVTDQDLYSVGVEPSAMAYDPQRHLLYLASRLSSMVLTLDLVSGDVNPNLAVMEGEPVALDLTPAGADLLCARWKASYVTVVDPATLAVSGEIPLKGENPVDVLVAPDGSAVYVALFSSHTVARLTFPRTKALQDRYLDVGRKPSALALDPDGRLWVTNLGSHSVSLVDAAEMRLLREVRTGKSPRKVVFRY